MPKIKDIINDATTKLRSVCDSPKKEVMTLLGKSLQKDMLWLMSHDNDEIDIPKDFFINIKKREESTPLEYILKSATFYSREFFVDERVLIPRPETEILVEKVISTCRELKEPTIVEIGVGSGIISILLALFLPEANIIATDISQDALIVAKINAKKHGVDNHIKFINCNLLDDVRENIDILVSNPPYIKNDEILEKNLSYEPDLALFGGVDGDEILKNIMDEAVKRKIVYLACEMGFDQKEKIINYLEKFNLKADFYKDLAGIDRGFILQGR